MRCDPADTTARYVLIPQASRGRAFDAVIGEVSLDRRGIWRGIVAGAGRPNFGDLPGKRGAAPLAKRLDPSRRAGRSSSAGLTAIEPQGDSEV